MFEFHTNRHAYHELLHRNAIEHIIPFIQKEMIIGPGSRVLEIGSGDGGNISAFLTLGCSVVGVELDPNLVEFTKQKLDSYISSEKLVMLSKDIYDADIENDLGGKFDLIILKDVIEHIHDQPKLFRRMKEMLNERGMIFFGFPPWQMPYGGHQQICRGTLTSKMPWYHLLPRSWYKRILEKNNEPVEVLMEIRDTGISIERFEKIAKDTGYQTVKKQLWLVNPVYENKFGFRARRQLPILRSIPWLRNFFTTCAYYLLKPMQA
ncbi:MAG: class I SAM-dependent methyltransferase [Chitinophagaceae bacterium]|jgi:SAM-dependent methyltransferase|nr:class I SAM-dependent methyltransferase [Chitinophagaceae bacterium]